MFKSNGSDFLTEAELPNALITHLDQDEAHDRFIYYHRREQAFKCYPHGFREEYLKKIKNGQDIIQQELSDYGVVVDTYEVSDKDPTELAKEINLFEANHGEHY